MNIRLSAFAAAGVALAFLSQSAEPAHAENGKWVIALSNGYYGNTWRHQMVDAYEAAARQAKEQGKIAEFITLNGDGSVNAQVGHFNDLILRGVDAILVNAASEVSLNGVIAKACAAGIKVIAIDSVPTADCAWKLKDDFTDYGTQGTLKIAEVIGGKGNVLVVRGVKGSGPDAQIYAAEKSVIAKNPDMKIVGEVYGGWSGPVAQAAVTAALPNLPHIDAVLGQGGGDAYGILQAFLQSPSYADKMPVIMGGGEADFIKWWQGEAKKTGYSTVSVNPSPTIGEAGLWYALAILNGANPPKEQLHPLTIITNDNLESFTDLKPNQMVQAPRDESWVINNLLKGAQ